MKGLILRLSMCLVLFTILLFSYLEKHNTLTKLRLSIPKVTREIKEIKEENTRLTFEIEQFESPNHLMELARRSEFSHLKNPLIKDVLLCAQGRTFIQKDEAQEVEEIPRLGHTHTVTLAVAKP